MHDFTPLPSLLGGLLIGLSASLLLLFNGRIAGVSGILGGVVVPTRGDVAWRVSFVAGLVVAGLVLARFMPAAFADPSPVPWAGLAVAGFVVGVGTSLGNGCTSGHGVCGLSRFSPRSLVATLTFMAAGGVTVFVIRHVLGGGR